MKDWDYYRTPKSPFFGNEEKAAYREQLLAEIESKRMTGSERKKALAEVEYKVREHMDEKNAPYMDELVRLLNEFWSDARAELGYDQFLDDSGVSALEHKAYVDGHAHGHSEIFIHLEELTEFAKRIIKGARKANDVASAVSRLHN